MTDYQETSRMRTLIMSVATVLLVVGVTGYLYLHRGAFDIATN